MLLMQFTICTNGRIIQPLLYFSSVQKIANDLFLTFTHSSVSPAGKLMKNRQLTEFLKQLNRVAQAPRTREELLGHKIPSRDKVLLSFGRAVSPLLQKKINILVWNVYKAKKRAGPTT